MADTTLNDFVREALAKGESRARIAAVLKSAGWPEDQVADALGAFADVDFATPVPRPRSFGGAREAFLYIVFYALLGVFAVQLGAVAFAFVDATFADALDRGVEAYAAERLRWSIAALVVGYPLFLFLGWRLSEARRKNPQRRVSRVRVWLTYITLIFAALTLIGDLVAIVYNFLSGEVGGRFLSKAGIVGVISAAILWNFTRDAERQEAGVDWPGRILAVAATIVTVALVVWAFLLVDTPAAARERALDERRLQDLQIVVRKIDCHRTYFDEPPQSLEAMDAALAERAARAPAASGCATATPKDPATDAPYKYERLDDNSVRLCAVFARGWPDTDAGDRATTNYWPGRDRRAFRKPESGGETCFELEAVDFEPGENSSGDPVGDDNEL